MTFEVLANLLRCFEGVGAITLTARSFEGFGQTTIPLRLPFTELPLSVSGVLADGWSVRIPAVTASGRRASLPVAIVKWRPRTRFDRSTRWRQEVDGDALRVIHAALDTMPAPSCHIEAGPEIWAAWRLAEAVTDPQEIARVLGQLAQRLGAQVPNDISTLDLPIAGPIRNWGAEARFPRVVAAAPDRIYQLSDLFKQETVNEHPSSTGVMGRRPTPRKGRPARSSNARLATA